MLGRLLHLAGQCTVAELQPCVVLSLHRTLPAMQALKRRQGRSGLTILVTFGRDGASVNEEMYFVVKYRASQNVRENIT